ncbi:acyl-CoA thioesterase [Segniliparus rugosus]|uniref:Acyl-CoA thioesterase n=1 Tax=Segniliparus rugosus (strain ATCC BAA-974 / DSM 45345 / CCUG 50838 / CIP 108380 / JCM 13579 / CDC 945) TaxID=679197 RepID=E5XP81_SEGRC|nr:thioesterase family protein [Segniliparus rugosus]EFV13839.1 hypothetical protein HMPREF9336_01302 [Segniliparus rugosus ATCC BAA-974]
MQHAFDATIAAEAVGRYDFAARTSPAYANMVSPFGGVTAATVVAAVQSHPEALGSPLALTINYLAPLEQGDWTLALRPLRTNRTNQHWSFTAHQGETAVLSGTAVLGLARQTWGENEAKPPAADAPEAYPVFEFPEFATWAKNYESRFIVGALAAEPADDSTSTLWIRDNPPRPLDHPALTALADTFFPRVFLRQGSYMPAGTVSLTVYYHATKDELAAHGEAHVLATARAARFGHGHFDQYGQLFGQDGTLLATTHQLVYFKDPK